MISMGVFLVRKWCYHVHKHWPSQRDLAEFTGQSVISATSGTKVFQMLGERLQRRPLIEQALASPL